MKPKRDIIRRCIFRPYRKGMGPVFTLTMWDTHRHDEHYGTLFGKSILGYRLTMTERDHYATSPVGRSAVKVTSGWRTVTLFEGEDFHNSPMYAIDSDAAVEALMGFLTLRPGDTDSEYFDKYTTAQRNYCDQWAEALGGEVQARFCDDNGNVITDRPAYIAKLRHDHLTNGHSLMNNHHCPLCRKERP